MQTLAALVVLWLLLFGLARLLRSRWSGAPLSSQGVGAGGAIALAAWGFFWRIITGDAFMPADGGDLAAFLLPVYRFVQESLRAGEWPLWNPYLYGGAPFVGDAQSALFYPLYLLLWLLLPGRLTYTALEALSILHIFLAGLGMYICLRDGHSRVAALFGALAFMFSDLFIVHFGNLNLIAVVAWFPWTFWAFERACTRRQARWAVLAGLCLGIGTLAGHPQMTLFIALALAMHTGLRILLAAAPMPEMVTAGRALAMTGGVATGISAVALLPLLELTAHTGRAAWTYGQTVAFSLSPAQWVGLLIPGFFGRSPQFAWGLWPRVEVGYIGVSTVVLAAFALAMRPDRPTARAAALAALAMVVSLGVYSVAHGWLTAIVPGLAHLRAPARFIFVFDFAVALLAARGLDAVHKGMSWQGFAVPWRWLRRFIMLAWGALLPLGYGALLWSQTQEPALHLRVSVILIALVFFVAFLTLSLALLGARRHGWLSPRAFGFLALTLLYVDLASLGAYNDISDTDPSSGFHDHAAIVQFLRQQPGPFRIDTRTDIDRTWQPDMALYHRLEDVGGIAHPLMLADPARFWEALGSRSSRLYDFLNIAYVIARKDVVLDWDKFELAFDGDPTLNIYRNRAVLPRAFVVYRATAVANQEQAWQAIRDPRFDPSLAVIVEGGEALSGGGMKSSVTVVERGLNYWTLDVTTAAPAYLVLSEVYFPGWRAAVNGEPQPILRANAAYRAVFISQAGEHRVRLWYAPASLRRGAVMSGMTVVGLLLATIVSWRRARR